MILADLFHEGETTVMDDETYWKLVAFVWIGDDFPHLLDEWPELLTADRPGREAMMDAAERDKLAALPKRVEVHRGSSFRTGPAGLSWTLDRERAVWFAKRPVTGNGMVTTGRCLSHRIIALLDARSESEILVFPRYVYDRQLAKA